MLQPTVMHNSWGSTPQFEWCCCDCFNKKTLLIDEHHVLVSCHPVPRPVIHRDLQPESVSSSDCAKVMHCPFLKEFLRWKAVEPCKTRTGSVDLLDTLIFFFFFWCCFWIMAQFKSSSTKQEDFPLNHLESCLFFQVLVEDTSRDEGSSTTTGILHSEVSLWFFSYSRKHSRLESLGYLLWSAGRDVGMWGWVWWRVQNLFCDVSFAMIFFSLGSFCASTFPWNMN